MPYTVTTITLPCGSLCVRAEGSGVIGKEDADHLMTFIGPDGSMFGVPMLVLAQKVKSFSAEARNLFGAGFDGSEKQAWCGAVATNPLIRVASNFMMRVSGNRKVKMFSTEEAAVRWLDERAREGAASTKVKAKAS